LFGLSGWEIAIIALFGFMIFGPDKLPQIARTVGRAIRQFRSAQEQMNKVIKAEVYDPLKDLEPLANPFAGFSLEESKTDAKKQGSAKAATKGDGKAKAAKVVADTQAAVDTDADDADTQAAAGAEEKKVSGDALKAAISEEAEKAKQKVAQDNAKKAAAAGSAAASPTSESFAQRRARLEREHAKAKAAASTPDDRKEDEAGA
jgi:colicin import membrane protein